MVKDYWWEQSKVKTKPKVQVIWFGKEDWDTCVRDGITTERQFISTATREAFQKRKCKIQRKVKLFEIFPGKAKTTGASVILLESISNHCVAGIGRTDQSWRQGGRRAGNGNGMVEVVISSQMFLILLARESLYLTRIA